MKHSITIIIIFPLLLTSPLFRQFMITTNSSQSDTIQVKSPILVKQTKFWYILSSTDPPIGNLVKHLLITLSFLLLLSSPLFGKETGVLFQYETSSGLVWKSFGNGKVQPKYEELSKRKGFLNQLRFYYFVLIASLRDIGKEKTMKEE